MDVVLQDIAFAWRSALKRPATALLIVVTLALGIGANSAMFSMTWNVLLAPLPYDDGDRLVRLKENGKGTGGLDTPWSSLTLADYRDQSLAVEDFFHYTQNSFTLLAGGAAHQVFGGEVSANFLDVLGIRPEVGRGFASGEDITGAAPLMLLSRNFWTRTFGADPSVIGRSVEMNGLVLTIIGVLPDMPPYPHANDVWITQAGNPYRVLLNNSPTRNSRWLDYVFGKLREDLTLSEARLDLNAIAQRLRTRYPDNYSADYSIGLEYVKDEMVGNSKATFLLLLGLATLIVVIASANVASLNLARLAARSQELAIREAVGGSPGRIARQLFTESLFFALAGGVAGIGLAWLCQSLLADFAARYTPLSGEIGLNGTVLLFTLVITLLTGVLSGCAAAFSRRKINGALKEGGEKSTMSLSARRQGQALLATQYAISFVILTTSALISLSLYQLNSQETGYDSDRVLAVSMALNVDLEADPQQFPQQIRHFGTELLSGVSSLPGVTGAGLLTGRPLLQESYYDPPREDLAIEGADAIVTGTTAMASADYFRVMNIPLLLGRTFSVTDDENAAPAAIVNEDFARNYFGASERAIGKRIRLVPWQEDWWTIVGVVGNVRSRQLDSEEGEAVYYNFLQFPGDVMNLYVKASSDLRVLAGAIEDVVREVSPRQSIASMQPLNEIRSDALAPARLRAVLISLFGFLALAVTLSGVIGVVSYSLSQRTREIGVYMAVGANPSDIERLFILRGMGVYLAGLSLGVVLMLTAAPAVSLLLYQTSGLDVRIYLLSAVLLSTAVVGAMYLPVRKASALSPARALNTS